VRFSWAGLLVAALLFGPACGDEPAPVPERPTPTPEVAGTPQTVTRTVQDQLGRTVALGDHVQRVAALSPAAADYARALGLEVVTRSSDTPAEFAPGASAAGATVSPDFAAIAEARPDLVIADANYHSGRTRDFDRFVYPVFVVKSNSYDEVLAALGALGDAVGRRDEAAAVLGTLEQQRERALARAKAGSQRVLILTGGGRDVFAGGESTYLGSLVAELGAVNVFGNTPSGGPLPGFGVVEVSQAASLAPDVVLVLSSGQGGLVDQIKADPAWSGAPAVRAGRVLEVDTLLFLRAAGPRAGLALEELARILWP